MVVPEEIRTDSYYYNLLPLYLKNSVGFFNNLQIFLKLAFAKTQTVDNEKQESIYSSGEELFKLIDIFCKESVKLDDPSAASRNYLGYLNTLRTSANSNFDILDKLGAFFGVSRNFSVVVDDEIKQISLNDTDMLTLIKSQVVKNCSDGSSEQMSQFYKSACLPIMTLTSTNTSCKVYMILSTVDQVSDNVKNMFLSGLLTNESMGIHYTYAIQVASVIAVFDSTVTEKVFDAGQFIM